jgi:hypothetical protein
MREDERFLCGVCAARLAGQEPIGWLALLLTAGGLFALALHGWSPWWLAVAGLGVIERYVAVRLAIDTRLFGQLARPGLDLAGLDAALSQLKMVPAAAGVRPLAPRLHGALAWARRHTMLVAAQAACAAVAVGAR